MFNRISIIAALSCSLWLLTGCHTAEPPMENDDCLWDLSSRHNVTIHLNLNQKMDFFQEVRVDEAESKIDTRSSDGKCLRYTVKVFISGTDTQIASSVGFSPEVVLPLPIGKLDIIAWVDYSDGQSTKDCYFFTDEWNELLVFSKYPYLANDPYKMGYWGKTSLTMAYNRLVVDLDVLPAMGQLQIIATDNPSVEVSGITISYPQRVPAAINGFTGKVSYSWADVSFLTTALPDEDGMQLLCFDNIFADDEPIAVPIKIEMKGTDGEVVARTLNIEAPIKRGGITEVRAPFYSILETPDIPGGESGGNGGITIDSRLDEEVIIELK